MRDEQNTASDLQSVMARERRRIVGLCARLAHDPTVAEDLAQETFIEAWRHRDNLRDQSRTAGWLSGIARNVCLRWLQRQKHGLSPWQERSSSTDGDESVSLEALPDDTDLEAELEHDELVQLLDRAMARLPLQTRTILERHLIDEAAHAEIALHLGMSESAVKVRLHRGKRALRRLLLTDFAESAAAYGLAPIPSEHWEETRLWCTLCGRERLQGRLTSDTSQGEFVLLCRHCFAQSGLFFHNSGTDLLEGVTHYKPALTRIMTWSDRYYRQAFQRGAAPCMQCGHSATISMCKRYESPAHPDGMWTLIVSCPACAMQSNQSLAGLVLALPQSREFLRAHPRVMSLPERMVETHGSAAIVTSYRSVTDSAQLDVVSALDVCNVLSIHRNDL